MMRCPGCGFAEEAGSVGAWQYCFSWYAVELLEQHEPDYDEHPAAAPSIVEGDAGTTPG